MSIKIEFHSTARTQFDNFRKFAQVARRLEDRSRKNQLMRHVDTRKVGRKQR